MESVTDRFRDIGRKVKSRPDLVAKGTTAAGVGGLFLASIYGNPEQSEARSYDDIISDNSSAHTLQIDNPLIKSDQILAQLGLTLTPTPGSGVGGRGLELKSSPTSLNWQGGTGQSKYEVLRWMASSVRIDSLPPGGLPATAGAFLDQALPELTCYMLRALGSNNQPLANTDLECIFPNIRSANAPLSGIRSTESNIFTLFWAADPTIDSYIFIKLGEQTPPIFLPKNQTSYNYNTGGQFSCFVWGGVRQGAVVWNPDVFCGLQMANFPNIDNTPTRTPTRTTTLQAILTGTPTPIIPSPTATIEPIIYHYDSGILSEDRMAIERGNTIASRYFLNTFGFTMQHQVIMEVRATAPGPNESSLYADVRNGLYKIFVYTATPDDWQAKSSLTHSLQMVHERTHLMQHELSNGVSSSGGSARGPRWLQEGGAEYNGYRAMVNEGYTTMDRVRECNIVGVTRTSPIPPLSEFEINFNYGGALNLSTLAVDNLVNRAGIQSLNTNYQSLATMDWRVAFRGAFGIDIQDFYTQFNQIHQSYPSHYGEPPSSCVIFP